MMRISPLCAVGVFVDCLWEEHFFGSAAAPPRRAAFWPLWEDVGLGLLRDLWTTGRFERQGKS